MKPIVAAILLDLVREGAEVEPFRVAGALASTGDHPLQITLDSLLARTRQEEDCLIWSGHANGGRFPQWRIGGELYLVRRLVWEEVHGPIRPGHQIGVQCGCDLCVAPDCLVSRTKSRAAPRGRMSVTHQRRIAASRRRNSALTPEIVSEIRMSNDPANVLDERFGLKAGYASRIRQHRVWADYSNPFAGLGAR